MATLAQALQQQQQASRLARETRPGPYSPVNSSPAHPYPPTPTLSDKDFDKDSLFDLDDFNDQLSAISSPAHSIQSEQYPGYPEIPAFGRAEIFKPRRSSFEDPRQQQQQQQQQAALRQGTHRFERKSFLTPTPSQQPSPSASPDLRQAFPASGSGSASVHGSGSGAYAPGASPLFPSAASSPPHPLGAGGAPSPSAYPGPTSRTPSLRAQVLIRTSSNHSQDLDSADDDFFNVYSECLNFEDVEEMCQDRELEKDTLDSVTIVALPCHIPSPDATQYVLYGLYFSSTPDVPTLPGDKSTKMLFPLDLQSAAGGRAPKVPNSLKPRGPKVGNFQPFQKAPNNGGYQTPLYAPMTCS